MNTNTQITLSQAVQGFMYTLNARRLSENTILDYQNSIGKFQLYLKQDLPIDEITARDIEGFLISQQEGRTNKTLLNYYVGLSALWNWTIREKFATENVVRAVPAPEPEDREVIPYTREEVKAMLNALGRTRVYQRAGQRPSDHAVRYPEKNRAIILLLLDTGIRASELCGAKICDLDQRNSRIHVFGKGSKERHIPFSGNTGQAIWRYLAMRPAGIPTTDPLFTTSNNRSFGRRHLLDTFQIIGARAAVKDVTLHRFRHTFAIQYLRNGGDPYTLQAILGHSSLEMTRRYVSIAQVDLETVHRRASPVDNWRL